MLDSQSSSPLDTQLRLVRSKCQHQQERLRIQKRRLRLQQLKVLGAVIEPVRNETSYDGGFLIGRSEFEWSWQESGLFG